MTPPAENRAAVIGSPISHSLSPAIFSLLGTLEKKSIAYQKIEVLPRDLISFLSMVRSHDSWVGLNVTIPHKESVIPELDQISEEARLVGAVNVIHRRSIEGISRLAGCNTDVIGIEKTLEAEGFIAKDKNVLLWGAGGAAKAVAAVLGRLGAARVVVFNPRSPRGEALALQFGKNFPNTQFSSIQDLKEVSHTRFSLVVNSTPVGMKEGDPQDFFSGLETLKLEGDALAFDLIYTPEETLFLKQSRQCGTRTVGGLTMLIEQALATWEIWIGPLRERGMAKQKMKDYLRGILALRENLAPVFLTGFMGVGKSSVAVELSRLTGREGCDTDTLIRQKSGFSVTEIFEKQGEAEFRALERQTVCQLTQEQKHGIARIVALGGGALMNPENLDEVCTHGILVYLEADEATLQQRIQDQGAHRPLLAGLSASEHLEKIRSLLLLRKPVYEKARLMIPTHGKSPVEVAQEILIRLGACA